MCQGLIENEYSIKNGETYIEVLDKPQKRTT